MNIFRFWAVGQALREAEWTVKENGGSKYAVSHSHVGFDYQGRKMSFSSLSLNALGNS